MKKKIIYIIGSLENPRVNIIANKLRKALPNVEIFDSWKSPGKFADKEWRKYEKAKGLTYKQALQSYAAQHIFNFDKTHLDRATDAVLIMNCGKSCHLELGYFIGKGKPGYILFEREPKRWDVMVNFAKDVFTSLEDLVKELKK